MSSPSTFVLIPGAGGRGWFWHLVVRELEARGAEAIAVDLPAADERAGLAEYAEVVVDAIGDRTDVVLAAQSLGGFTGPLVAAALPDQVRLLVLVNAMVPAPGEAPGEWWSRTRHRQARLAQAARDGRDLDDDADLTDAFFHDVPEDVKAEAFALGEPEQAFTPMERNWPLAAWPDVETRFLQGREDRFFPIEFQREVVAARLGIDVDEMPGGHLAALSQPVVLAERLLAYAGDH